MDLRTIIYIGSFELPDKNAAAHRVIANGKLLRDLGYNVVFVGISQEDSNRNDEIEKEVSFGFDCYKRKKAKSNKEWFRFLTDIQPYREVIKKYKNVYGIIGYNLPSLVLLSLRKEAKKNDIKIFSDCTEWYEIRKKGNGLLKFLIRYLDVSLRMKVINQKLDGVIAISNYLYNYYYTKGVKTVQIPPLVDTTDEKWKNEFLQASSGKIQLVYAGTPFSLYKEPSYKDRLDLIIESLYELKKEGIPFQMHIIGIEKNTIAHNFPQLGTALEFFNDSLVFHGKLPHLEVIKILKSVDYSLFLRYNSKSIKAGFPTKLVESISCGIPVLTNINSNIQDYLREGNNGFWIKIDNKESIVASLKSALTVSRDQISEMKKKCFESKIFDYRNYIQVFNDFLHD